MKLLGQVRAVRHFAPGEATGAYASQLMADLGAQVIGVAAQPGWIVEAARAAAGSGWLVGDLRSPAPVLSPAVPMSQAVLAMASTGAKGAWVAGEGSLPGVVSLEDVLAELSLNRDPLTGLPGSDRLREWGRDNLGRGQEISILFMDLNDFARYNKQHGHVVGDKVLKALVKAIEPMVDHRTDVFVRYGGDEFVWATTQPRTLADANADMLRSSSLHVPDVPYPVTFCVGVSGGKRTKERTALHIESTLDNLINKASQHALSQKPPKEAARPLLSPQEAFRMAIEELRRSRPARAERIGDVRYSVEPGSGLVLRLLDQEGQVLGSAPMGEDLSASFSAAVRRASEAG